MPNKSDGKERRFKRVAASIPVKVRTAGVEHECVTKDISEGGIFFHCDAQMTQGSNIELVLVLPEEITGGAKRWVCCQAKVTRREEDTSGRQTGIAAEIERFDYLPEAAGSE